MKTLKHCLVDIDNVLNALRYSTPTKEVLCVLQYMCGWVQTLPEYKIILSTTNYILFYGADKHKPEAAYFDQHTVIGVS